MMASESERDYGQEESLLGKEEDGYYTPAEVQKPHTKLLWVGFVFAIVASLLAGFFVGQMQHKPIEKYGYPCMRTFPNKSSSHANVSQCHLALSNKFGSSIQLSYNVPHQNPKLLGTP
jgi:hypothetical protein